jgi:hypothetical protein
LQVECCPYTDRWLVHTMWDIIDGLVSGRLGRVVNTPTQLLSCYDVDGRRFISQNMRKETKNTWAVRKARASGTNLWIIWSGPQKKGFDLRIQCEVRYNKIVSGEVHFLHNNKKILYPNNDWFAQ